MGKILKKGQILQRLATIGLVGFLLFGSLPARAGSLVPAKVEEADLVIEAQVPDEPPSIQDILLEVCTARGYGEDCAKTLLGMAWKESNFIAKARGDGGRARGWFQIWYKMHKISLGCAEDLRCSAEWTIDYLESNSYPKYKNYAIQCHNGCNIANGYAASVIRHGKRLWHNEQPYVIALAR